MSYDDPKKAYNLVRDFEKTLRDDYRPTPYQAMGFLEDMMTHLAWISEQVETDEMSPGEKIAAAEIVAGIQKFKAILQDAEIDRLSAAPEREERV